MYFQRRRVRCLTTPISEIQTLQLRQLVIQILRRTLVNVDPFVRGHRNLLEQLVVADRLCGTTRVSAPDFQVRPVHKVGHLVDK